MFTIKSIIENATVLHQQESVVIGRKGSPQYKDALSMCGDNFKEFAVDFIIDEPPAYNAGGEETSSHEGYRLVAHRAQNPSEADPIAVIISDEAWCSGRKLLPDETFYQFIYKGDEVYIMNDKGQTIESIK